jgi:hypothetical protein
VPKRRHRSFSPVPLVCAATLTLVGLLPATASAGSEGVVQAASPVAERAAAAEERRATRAQERAERREARAQEHAQRRAARAQERAERRAAKTQRQGVSQTTAAGQTTTAGAPARGCSVTISASSQRIVAGETVTVSGALACPTDSSAGTQQLAIAQDQPGSSQPAAAATVTTEADGSYSFTSAPLSATTVFRVRIGRHGAHVAVRVAPLVTLSGPAASTQPSAVAGAVHRGRRRATFTGTVDPYDAGALVGLQVSYPSSPSQWRTISYTRVDANGSYSISHNFIASGTTLLRTLAYGSKHKAPAVSQALPYDPPQPQNAALTIGASADPLASGQTVTIAGVATGTPGQTVTLRARTPAGAMIAVATTSTDGAGNYAFTQMPLENTYYRVTDATASSTVLFEGVSLSIAPDAASESAKVGEPVSFSGTLALAGVGQAVRLERAGTGYGFQMVASAVAGADAKYAVAYTFTDPGTYTMRVRVAGDGKNLAGASEPIAVVVTE